MTSKKLRKEQENGVKNRKTRMDFYQNQEVIFNSDFTKESLTFLQGKRLNDSIETIIIEGDEDIYYNGEQCGESIESKFRKLINKNGWIHFVNGTSYGVKNGKIIEVKLTKDSLDTLTRLNQKTVESKLGKPSKIEHDIITYVFDPVDEGDIYYFKKKGLSIQFDPETKRIKELRIK